MISPFLFKYSRTEKSSQWSSRPKFLNTLLNVTAVEGSSVKLICEVDGTPEPAIKWNKNSGNLTEDQRIVIERRRFESLVKIGKVAVRDQGKYSCTGDNGVGPAITSHGWLIVTPRGKQQDISFVNSRYAFFIT